MGNARYSKSAFDGYSTANLYSVDGTRKSVAETFNFSSENKDLNPVYIKVRESRDSELNPESRPIIFAIDFTASMGHVSHEMVNEYVPKIMSSLINGYIKDPHLMAIGIRDFKSDGNTPIQVSQFEADHSVVEQMQAFYAPGRGGGGNEEESYALAWAFAAFKTETDCFTKRGQKGYLFTIGDDGPQTGSLSDDQMRHLIGTGEGMSVDAMQKAASEKYDLFHIHLNRGNGESKRIMTAWREKLGNRAIELHDYTKVPELVETIISLNEGADPTDLNIIPEVRKALNI